MTSTQQAELNTMVTKVDKQCSMIDKIVAEIG